MVNASVNPVPVAVLAAFLISSTWAATDPAKVSGPESWADSPHANANSESFTHWNDDGEIPENCAACHSETGFIDFIGADGTTAGLVDHPAAPGTVVSCDTCHNDTSSTINEISFPSGKKISNIESSAQCMICHQGRASTSSVDKAIASIDDDAISAELQFINVHYRAAAATLYGTEVSGGYEYQGKSYAGRFKHVPTFDSCSACHDAHTTEVRTQSCNGCHQSDQLADIRTSMQDYDADGDTKEGILYEIQSLHRALGDSIELYSQMVIDAPVLYHPGKYPYFFLDTNKDGSLSDQEAIYPNRYQQWTPRLLKAAYNYQFVAKDPGSYAHNPQYVLQLLHDSLDSLAGKVNKTNPYSRPE